MGVGGRRTDDVVGDVLGRRVLVISDDEAPVRWFSIQSVSGRSAFAVCLTFLKWDSCSI